MVTTSDQARDAARGLLQELSDSLDGDEAVITRVEEFPTNWVVWYGSKRHRETKDLQYALAGSPIVIDRRTGIASYGIAGVPASEQGDPE